MKDEPNYRGKRVRLISRFLACAERFMHHCTINKIKEKQNNTRSMAFKNVCVRCLGKDVMNEKRLCHRSHVRDNNFSYV